MNAPSTATILVSACLLGLRTRYDGDERRDEGVFDFLMQSGLTPIPVCPEQLGGLPTPRPAAEFANGDGASLLDGSGRLCDRNGHDVTEAFRLGAEQTLAIAALTGARLALLKERSPSCGANRVYRSGELVAGAGVTAALLRRHGIEVRSEEELSTSSLTPNEDFTP